MGQVSGSIFRWDGSTEDFIQEESYHVPDMVKMEFQVAQGQLAWLAGRGQETRCGFGGVGVEMPVGAGCQSHSTLWLPTCYERLTCAIQSLLDTANRLFLGSQRTSRKHY